MSPRTCCKIEPYVENPKSERRPKSEFPTGYQIGVTAENASAAEPQLRIEGRKSRMERSSLASWSQPANNFDDCSAKNTEISNREIAKYAKVWKGIQLLKN